MSFQVFFNLTQLSPVVVSGSVRSTPCQETRIWSILRIFIRFPDLTSACCTTCVASEPASSTPAYLPELTTAAKNIYWNCRYLQKWLVEQRLWVFHRFQTRSLHDFLILHTKVDASHQTNFLARQDGHTNSIFQRFGLLFFNECRQALARNTLWWWIKGANSNLE